MWKACLFLLVLLIPPSTYAQEQKNDGPRSKLFYRFDVGVSRHRLEESLIGLADAARQPDALLLIRVCSKEPMPKALVLSAASPRIIYDYMGTFYDFPPERIRLQRSEDCLGRDNAFAATELWVIPKDADVPPSVESVSLGQMSAEVIKRGDEIKSIGEFRAALRRLVKALREQPDSVGIVTGYYFNHPSPTMLNALREAKNTLGRNKLPKSKYLIHIKPWGDELPPSPSEPKYPTAFIMKKTAEPRAAGATF